MRHIVESRDRNTELTVLEGAIRQECQHYLDLLRIKDEQENGGTGRGGQRRSVSNVLPTEPVPVRAAKIIPLLLSSVKEIPETALTRL